MPAGRRLLICQPMGGLNDILCQVERCRAFAAKHGYRLLVNTETLPDSCIPAPFGDFFEMPNSNCRALLRAPADYLKGLIGRPTLPDYWAGRLHEPEQMTYKPVRGYVHVPTDRAGGLPWTELERHLPSEDTILVHTQLGGGKLSHQLFGGKRFQVSASFVRRCGDYWQRLARHVAASAPYLAMHVRHTDYRSPNYPDVIRSMLAEAAGKRQRNTKTRIPPLLVCSDSAEVIQFAREAAASFPGTTVLTTDDLAGDRQWFGSKNSIHNSVRGFSDREQIDIYMRQLLRDLYAMSHASQLKLIVPQPRKSTAGFSNLAAYLQASHSARDFFFQYVDRPGVP